MRGGMKGWIRVRLVVHPNHFRTEQDESPPPPLLLLPLTGDAQIKTGLTLEVARTTDGDAHRSGPLVEASLRDASGPASIRTSRKG